VYQRSTSRRITRYPEEEIIESLAMLLSDLCSSTMSWRRVRSRIDIVDNLEWIARRFESEYVLLYIGRDGPSDLELRRMGRGCAARFRAIKQLIAFPSDDACEKAKKLLWNALVLAANSRWSVLLSDERPEPLPSTRDRALSAGRSFIAIGSPAVLGIAAQSLQIDPALRANILLGSILLSGAALLATINPKQFEAQKLMDSFGSLLGKK
jgi:hypothetical protein